jgi:hypothetical protein
LDFDTFMDVGGIHDSSRKTLTSMKFLLPALAAFTLVFACNQPNSKEDSGKEDSIVVAAEPVPPAPKAPVVKTFTTKTGKSIVVTETHPSGASLSTVDVRFGGDKAAAFLFTDIDAVSEVVQADLDGNGFDEVYIITQAAGSGSYGKVHGMASNKDKSLTPVYMAEVSENDMKDGMPFEGYTGHDKFSISGKELIREFPIDKHGKTKRMIYYVLEAGEASWQLVIRKTMDM